jgi:hypothetical protein
MKRFILCVSLVVSAPSLIAAVPMVRFVRVIDSRTIVVQHAGTNEVVHLTNVNVPAQDEQAARAYLDEKLTGTFLYVENGEVYRSPDALFINRELAFRAYEGPSLKMHVFGVINPGPRPQEVSRAAPVREPMQVPKLKVKRTARK